MAKDSLAALRATAGTKPKSDSKKQSMPEVPAPADIADAIINWVDAKREMKSAESRMKESAGIIIEKAEKIRIERSRKDGKLYPSLRLLAKTSVGGELESDSAKYTRPAKMSAMDDNEENQSSLRKEFNDDFDNYFKITEEYIIDGSVLENNPKIAAELMKFLEKFGDEAQSILKRKATIAPTEAFWQDSVLKESVHRKVENLLAVGLCKQNAGFLGE